MPYFNIVTATSENTVVTEYEPVAVRSDSYQSEAALEQEFTHPRKNHRWVDLKIFISYSASIFPAASSSHVPS